MKVQRICLPKTNKTSWIVIDDDFLPIHPIVEFFTHLEALERSPNTVFSYACHLKLYWEFLKLRGFEWAQVTLSVLADFITWLRDPESFKSVAIYERTAKRSDRTINTILAGVSSFYDFHQRIGNVPNLPLTAATPFRTTRYKGLLHRMSKSKPPTARLLKLKVSPPTPQILTPLEVKTLIKACHCLRDRFLLSLLYETGMRIGQALGLRHSDIVSWENQIRIEPRTSNANGSRSKVKEPFTIHVSKELMRLYTDYLVNEVQEVTSDYVFVNLWKNPIGQPMSLSGVEGLFARLSRKTGIRARPHMFRHTHATELLQAGWDSAFVQKRLGHASIQTTLNTYIHLTDQDLKKAFHKYCESKKSQG